MRHFTENTNLKRSKRSFESTALRSLQQSRTVSKSYARHTGQPLSYINKSSYPTQSFKNHTNQDQEFCYQSRHIFQRLAGYIHGDQNNKTRQIDSKFMRHFYYQTISRAVKHPLMQVPQIVPQIYNQQLSKRNQSRSSPVGLSHGYLSAINCVYYAVENTVVFVKVEDLLNFRQFQSSAVPYFIQEVKDQVISIIEITQQSKLFPGTQIVLGVIHPWEMEFYAWESGKVLKNKTRFVDSSFSISKQSGLRPLHYIFQFPVEKVNAIAIRDDGSFYFFDGQGALHQIIPEQQKKLFICKTGRYKIKNVVNNSKNTFQLLSHRHGKFSPIFNFASYIYQVTKYLLPSVVYAEVVICDRRRNLLFALLRKKTKMLLGNEVRQFVVCYDIRKQAKLIHKFSEEQFIQRYAAQVQSDNLLNSRFQTIATAPPNSVGNLILITKSGIKVLMQIGENDAKLIQLIHAPDYRMFENQSSENVLRGRNVQYMPRQKSQYKVRSYLSDQTRSICTLTNNQELVFTYITGDGAAEGAIDANLQINKIDLEIYRGGPGKVSIYKISQLMQADSFVCNSKLNLSTYEVTSELAKQTFAPPANYLFLSTDKLQILTCLRPIDILFTLLTMQVKLGTTRKTVYSCLMSKQRLLSRIFLQPELHRYLGAGKLTFEELSAMLIQIVIDKDGSYWYSRSAAVKLMKIWISLSEGQLYSKNGFQIVESTKNNIQEKYKRYQQQYQNVRSSNKQYVNRFRSEPDPSGVDELISYDKISERKKNEVRQIYENFARLQTKIIKSEGSIDIFNEFVTNIQQPVSKPTIAAAKMTTIVRYLSLLISPLWNSHIDSNFKTMCMFYNFEAKLQHLLRHTRSIKQQIFVSDFANESDGVKNDLQQIIMAISKVRQLILLVDSVGITNKTLQFGECLLKDATQFEESMFWAIHRQFKYFVINKWRSLFPSFISNEFHKLILLYGELDEVSSKQKIIFQLKHQNQVRVLPQYFIQYLEQARGFTPQNIAELKCAKNLIISEQTQKQAENSDDFEFQIPAKIKEISDKYSRVCEQVSQVDLQQIIAILLSNKNNERKLTVANKQAIITFLIKNSILHPKIQYLSKCIQMQYELYRFYLRSVTKQPQRKIIFPFSKRQNKSEDQVKKENQETILLLKYNAITDAQILRKLVEATKDSLVLTIFCALFERVEEFKNVFRTVCDDQLANNIKDRLSFAVQIQKFVLNTAIRSKYNDRLLKIICQEIDRYSQSLYITRKYIKQWMRSPQIGLVDKSVLWLPQLLLKIGYRAEKLMDIYLAQLERVFNSSLPIQNQTLYCIKFLICYKIAKNYDQGKRMQLAKITLLQIDSLERNNSIEAPVSKGLKRMLNQLVC